MKLTRTNQTVRTCPWCGRHGIVAKDPAVSNCFVVHWGHDGNAARMDTHVTLDDLRSLDFGCGRCVHVVDWDNAEAFDQWMEQRS